MRIGWVGLGQIGSGMVRRLLKAGFDVTVYARGAGLAEVNAAGATTSHDYAALAAEAEALAICVFDDAQVRAVLFDGGALNAMRARSTLLIHTTGSPALMREIGARAPTAVDVLDATFSGGPNDAGAGTLTLMAGGPAYALERVRPALSTYCKQIFHMGALGQGQVVKLLNNLLLATNLMNAAEALKLLEGSGGDPFTAARAIQAASGRSFAMDLISRAEDISATIGAARRYLIKDVAVAIAAAKEAGLDVNRFADTELYYRN